MSTRWRHRTGVLWHRRSRDRRLMIHSISQSCRNRSVRGVARAPLVWPIARSWVRPTIRRWTRRTGPCTESSRQRWRARTSSGTSDARSCRPCEPSVVRRDRAAAAVDGDRRHFQQHQSARTISMWHRLQIWQNVKTCGAAIIIIRLFWPTDTRNSPGDEMANVNFLYDDIVHALQNTIDSCINFRHSSTRLRV